MNRRQFLGTTASLAAARSAPVEEAAPAKIDFRYAPRSWQTAFCWPDDHAKSLVGERGDLRYGHPGPGANIDFFTLRIEWDLAGMDALLAGDQRLEGSSVPIVHTRLDHPSAFLELTTFASNFPDEGRVDNVIATIRPRRSLAIHVGPRLIIHTRSKLTLTRDSGAIVVSTVGDNSVVLVANSSAILSDAGTHYIVDFSTVVSHIDSPPQLFIRFPQQGQPAAALAGALAEPGRVLAHARSFWREWTLFGGEVKWSLPGVYGDFLRACARNILQAREIRDGRLTFQVGPTVYRGLWVVDGNFLLEAARYLGHDREALDGLKATWARQEPDGAVFAGGGREHWKDTGIAMFSLVRQAELAQDWTYFREMRPNVVRSAIFLRSIRDRAKAEGSANGAYGLLARGMGDGGLGGIRSELTNTLWSVAGLRAAVRAASEQNLSGYDQVGAFYRELNDALFTAIGKEMRRHPHGFEYLPMLLKEDKDWNAADEWLRPQPQVAQWTLSHCIYPGLLFEPRDAVVRGHLALMNACTREDIPAETGWIDHEGVWNYNASFAAHAYLWARESEWAKRTFHGFLNHATPLYCWREEQPLAGSALAHYIGDMPHNWASAECVRYLRHMLAMEDGKALRLLPAFATAEPGFCEPFEITSTPTRFGRVDVRLEPKSRGRGWILHFARQSGQPPESIELPERLGANTFTKATAASRSESGRVYVDARATNWTATWMRA